MGVGGFQRNLIADQIMAENVAFGQGDGQLIFVRTQTGQFKCAGSVRFGSDFIAGCGNGGQHRAAQHGFVAVAQAVGVGVVEHAARKAAQRDRASQRHFVFLAHFNGKGCGDGNQTVMCNRIAALHGFAHFSVLGQQIAEGVLAGHHAVKEETAVFGGSLIQVDLAVLAQQANFRAHHAKLVLVPQAVIVHIVEEGAAYSGGRQHTGVHAADLFAHGNGDGISHAKIALENRHIAAVLFVGTQTGEAVIGLALHLYDVAAGHDTLEGVFAVLVGNGFGGDSAVFIQSLYDQAGDLLFLAVQATVVVRVLKHGAADGGAAGHAYQRVQLLAAFHHQRIIGVFAAAGTLLEQVDLIHRPLTGNGKDGAVLWQNGAELVGAGTQVFHAEGAVLLGLALAYGLAVGILDHFQRNAFVAGFALVIQTVVVEVKERQTDHRAALNHAHILADRAYAGFDGKHTLQVFAGKDAAQVAALGGVAGIEHALRQIGGHSVLVAGQAFKVVQAGFIRGNLTLGAGAFALHVDGYACNAHVLLVQNAVVVYVLKSHAAEGAHGADADKGLVFRIGGKYDRFAHSHIAVAGHAALLADGGKGIVFRQYGAQRVFAGSDGDGYARLAVGRSGCHNCVAVQHFHQHIGHALLIGSLFAVGVFVLIDGHSQLHAFAQANIRLHGGFAKRNGQHGGAVFMLAGIADAGGIQAFITHGGQQTVIAGNKTVEGILAVFVGYGLHGFRALTFQRNGYAGHQHFAAVVQSVGVRIHIGAAGNGKLLRKGGHGHAHQQT